MLWSFYIYLLPPVEPPLRLYPPPPPLLLPAELLLLIPPPVLMLERLCVGVLLLTLDELRS